MPAADMLQAKSNELGRIADAVQAGPLTADEKRGMLEGIQVLLAYFAGVSRATEGQSEEDDLEAEPDEA